MRVGIYERFAVEWEITEVVDDWIFGCFYLWIDGVIVGNKADRSVDLKGCMYWAHDLLEKPRDRYEPGLFNMPRNQVFLRLASPVLVHENPQNFAKEIYSDTFSRFHISHIGMSSFDRVTLLLLKDELGQERCVWKSNDGEVMDAYFEVGEIEAVVSQFILTFSNSGL